MWEGGQADAAGEDGGTPCLLLWVIDVEIHLIGNRPFFYSKSWGEKRIKGEDTLMEKGG